MLASAGCIPESSCAPEGMGGASAWVTRGGCHGGNCSNTDASIGSVLLAEDGEVPRRVALHCPMYSDGLCLVKIFGE